LASAILLEVADDLCAERLLDVPTESVPAILGHDAGDLL
jgi:hypothetical protein